MTDTFRSRAELEARQLEQLRVLVAAVLEENQFYGARLRAAGLTAPPDSLEEFRERAPFTTKQELQADQAAWPPFGTNVCAPPEDFVRVHSTSSTTGPPLRWYDTPRTWSWMVDGWVRVLEESGVGPTDRVFVAFGYGPFIGLWLTHDAAQRLGCLVLPGGTMTSVQRVRAVLVNRATVLCCTPTYAIHLGEVARAEGLDLADGAVRVIVGGGEPGASIPAVRRKIETLWPGAKVHDHHGMTETGPVTYQDPDGPDALRVMEDRFIVEVVDPETGAPRAAGDERPGELIVTNLGRVDMPVLRYRTRDLVVADPTPAADGRVDLRLVGGILGRADDLVIVRGVKLYPGAIDGIVHARPGVAEYRVSVDRSAALAEIALEVEATPDADAAALCAALEADLRDAFGLRVPVTPAGPDSLPRFELKARRWVTAEAT